ncbi:TetR/AcrR family transcriptional regulator [Slackia heliotrinireducens]|uniref:TetR/AcrR family transcriptional regulator n=1 Tax=Slackia heliotrinireducens TaxID=84110 RepID=UPI0033158807
MPKTTPDIRREAFVQAGIALFTERRYGDVSVRDVLDAVGVRTASPSVFYYYFKDKQSLYRTCIETVASSYVEALEQAFDVDDPLDRQIRAAYKIMADSMARTQGALGAGQPSQPFLLEARERVTQRCASLIEKLLIRENPDMPQHEARTTALFLAGGMGQVMWSWQASHPEGADDSSLNGTMRTLEALTDAFTPHLH